MMCATRRTDAPGKRISDEGELARAGLPEPVCDGEDGAVVLGDPPTAVGESLGLGEVTVLIENGGQRGDLLVEGEVRRLGQGAGDAPLAPLLEQLVDLRGTRAAQIPEQFGREIAVALRVQGFGRRGELVDMSGPAAP